MVNGHGKSALEYSLKGGIMKLSRLIIVIMVAAMGLLCWGCNDNTAVHQQFDDIYVIYKDYDTRLKKYNILTESITELCPDPVCDHTHESSCMFLSTAMQILVENGVCFLKDGDLYLDEETGQYMLPQSIIWYDYVKGNIKVLCTINGTKYEGLQGRLIYNNGYVYYTVRASDENETLYKLWRVSIEGGTPENLDLTTSWIADNIIDGWAWYADASGIYKININSKETEYIYTSEEGTTIAIYFFDEENGAYCIEHSRQGSMVMYIKDGKKPKVLLDGTDLSHLRLSGDTLCFQDGDSIFTYKMNGNKREKMFTPNQEERLSGLWSCGKGVVARYDNETEGTIRFIPIIVN